MADDKPDVPVGMLPRLLGNIQYDIRTKCWLWLGSPHHGYGLVRVGLRKQRKAHRVAYELLVGPVPDGLVLDHLCRRKRCINPAHLEPVTQAENIRRGTSPAALNRLRNDCKLGHPLRALPSGKRYCPTCLSRSQKRYHDKKRAARRAA